MQPHALTVDKFLDYAAKWHLAREIVTADAGNVVKRCTYAELRKRSNHFSGALNALGLRTGDRIATLAWNTQHHLEAYFAAMGAGIVCHTLNPRLTTAQTAAMINEAEDRLLIVACSLLPQIAELAPLCETIEHIVVVDGIAPGPVPTGRARLWHFEDLLTTHGAPTTWGAFDEETPAGLCYTSGTTGSPKGVVYTHRSNYLHTLRALQADALALTQSDVVLVAVPMFHANGWGLPFAAPAVGAKIVLPGRHTDGASIAKLIRDEGVTFAAGVPTVWIALLDHLEAAGGDLPTLQRILVGGAKCPDAMILRMEERFQAYMQTAWGMTELSPIGTITPPNAPRTDVRAAGLTPLGLDLKLTDAEGRTLPEQRDVVGHLKVKGPSVLDRYFKASADSLDAEGYFDTGDLAMIDQAGHMSICGRSKDLIKSGGEWINPSEIEEIVGCDPSVSLAAVIGRHDDRWGERPLLIVQPTQGRPLDAKALLQLLRGRVADWWIPDLVIQIDAMPLAATGKIDKKRLRVDFGQAEPATRNRTV